MKFSIIDKEKKVKEIIDKILKFNSIFITNYIGLNVQEITNLRLKFKELNIEYKIFKNTLIKRAFTKENIKNLNNILKGPIAIVFSCDPVIAAKILFDFIQKYKKLEIKCGILNKKIINLEEVKILSKLHSKEEMFIIVTRTFFSPIQKMHYLLVSPINRFLNVINKIKELKNK